MLCVHQVVSHANLLRIEFMSNPAVHRLQNAPLAATPIAFAVTVVTAFTRPLP